jgi:hypothetical protein
LRPLPKALLAAAACALLPGTAAAEPSPGLDRTLATRAIDAVRHTLPRGWEMTDIRWDTVPDGWQGPAECVYVKVEDTSISYEHPSGEFEYHSFYKVWILPPAWPGRMDVAELGGTDPQPVLLGTRAEWTVLWRTLGRNSWPAGENEIATALGVEPVALEHRPLHTLDVSAMQRLFQRLHFAAGEHSARWTRQIYGIEALESVLYLELLTWDERHGHEDDPTFLGEVAEVETAFLVREALAAFPQKRAIYLRRVTNRSVADVITVNPARFEGSS